jgi:hypothetical protein
MAHELGHGAFRLKHTFSDENSFVQDQGQTPNLMDYASGSELLKYQWDECHDFDLGCNWFEDGDEAEILGQGNISCISEDLRNSLKGQLFMSPDQKVIDIGTDAAPYAFYDSREDDNLKGRLTAYLKNGILYIAIVTTHSDNTVTFSGYSTTTVVNPNEQPKVVKGKPVLIVIDYNKQKIISGSTSVNSTCLCGSKKAIEFETYCKSKIKGADEEIQLASQQIQKMGALYDDYVKIALSANPYSTWVNSEENVIAFKNALSDYYNKHKDAPKVNNPNCTDCPKNPINGDFYWDKAGRNWVFMENKWVDFSGEFCTEGCNNDWKKN